VGGGPLAWCWRFLREPMKRYFQSTAARTA
jgi:hypothetical protein